ncbi:transcriptional coactivator/pterin dehydratase [Xylaria telfairii]|nr:transcriptional coactivator/pterin dehydratase [Xylaria telfairii]
MSRGKAIQAIHMTSQAVKQSQFPFTRTQLRRFQASPGVCAMAHAAKVQFATGADETTLTAALQGLLDSAEKGGRWTLISSGRGLERSFKFKNFAKTWVYNTTYIRWTTHNPPGLSAKDVELAGLCDALARDFGEVDNGGGGGSGGDSCGLRQVADRVVADAGDCCTPKKT